MKIIHKSKGRKIIHLSLKPKDVNFLNNLKLSSLLNAKISTFGHEIT